MVKSYWSWEEMLRMNEIVTSIHTRYKSPLRTKEALAMLNEEGL